jgi:D-amino peptidase
MRIMISADMEGATGVTWSADVAPGTEQWQRFRRMFTGDVNACVAGLGDGGASEVLVNEAHDTQRNLLLEELDPRARMLTGRHKPLSMMQGIDSRMDGVVFLGYHAGAGVDGVLSHTYLPNSITGVWLDGIAASEGRLNAALAAEHGVPVLVVTGDDLTCADAADYAPGAQLVAVKECVSRYAAICSPPSRTAEQISTAARAGMAAAGRTEPRPSAHHIEVEFDATHLAQAAAVVPTVEPTGIRRVGFHAPTMTEAMKAFKVVTAIVSGAVEESYG